MKYDPLQKKSHSNNCVFVGCNYDGGDCCLSKVNTRDCTECICKQDMVKQISYENLGAKYLVFFSSRSLKKREKYISFAQLVLLILYVF